QTEEGFIPRHVPLGVGPNTLGSYGTPSTTTCGLWRVHARPSPGNANSGRDSGGTVAQALASVPQEHGHGGPSIMERFKRMAPPSFNGESQPLLAESWMRDVEMIFRAIRCMEEDKVSLATYMLQVLRVYVLV
ncbi:hypothetical protein Taro_029291, partial [Colocasia esculenta]|nr:hypothetical protein [Colocasia esculenta]